MGFFRALGKIIAGEPVFTVPVTKKAKHKAEIIQPSQTKQATTRPAEPEKLKLYDEYGQKIVPNVYVARCIPRLDLEDMDVWAYIRNDSDFEVELQNIEVLAEIQLINHRLLPHTERRILIYSGDRPTTDINRTAKLYYERVETNDYFCADHYIRYKMEHDDTFSIYELDIERPVHHI